MRRTLAALALGGLLGCTAFATTAGAGIALGPDGIAFAYLAGTHISNAGLSHPNNGTETLLLMLTLPLAR
jgi:hypothetical protein